VFTVQLQRLSQIVVPGIHQIIIIDQSGSR
jgi:hypothetical protein